MRDKYLRYYYQLHGLKEGNLSPQEQRRIAATLDLVPASWQYIVDVGCGDGRVTRPLISTGVEVVGLDWSDSSLRNFSGKKVVADIRELWPLNQTFDGAICAEVLEHLTFTEAQRVVANIQKFTRQGFIISVPAREQLEVHTVPCPQCGHSYHVWGHVQSFRNAYDVDALVGQVARERHFVPSTSVNPSVTCHRLRWSLGYLDNAENAMCPFCGTKLVPGKTLPSVPLVMVKALFKLEQLTSFCRSTTGWFICRYDK